METGSRVFSVFLLLSCSLCLPLVFSTGCSCDTSETPSPGAEDLNTLGSSLSADASRSPGVEIFERPIQPLGELPPEVSLAIREARARLLPRYQEPSPLSAPIFSPENLKAVLPAAGTHWKLVEEDGRYIDAPGMRFSMAFREYASDSRKIRLEITDARDAPLVLQNVQEMLSAPPDSGDSDISSLTIDEEPALMVKSVEESEHSLVFIYRNRLLVRAHAQNLADAEVLETFVRMIAWSRLK